MDIMQLIEDIQNMTSTMRALYDAYIDKGFDREQALELVKAHIMAAANMAE